MFTIATLFLFQSATVKSPGVVDGDDLTCSTLFENQVRTNLWRSVVGFCFCVSMVMKSFNLVRQINE